jgi:hypothetical protein
VIPTLILSFQRKDQLEKLIRVATAQGSDRIYISIDGPRDKHDGLVQSAIIKMISQLRLELDTEIIARHLSENAGAGAAVISGIDWFFEFENKGIILEDDLSPEPGFFHAADQFINRTDLDERILMFSGTNLFDLNSSNVELLKYPVVWGWATTRPKWEAIRRLIFLPPSDLSFRKLGTQYFYWRVGKQRALQGKTKVWDVPLSGAMFGEEYLCAITPTNMIANIGFDSFASNTLNNEWPLNIPTVDHSLDFGSIPVTSANTKNLEKFMRKKVFKFGLKYFLSSLFWSIFDSFRLRKSNCVGLHTKLSIIDWKMV